MVEPVQGTALESEAPPQLSPSALAREARQVGANALLLARPPGFAPGAEIIQLYAIAGSRLPNGLLPVSTAMGDFVLRLTPLFAPLPAFADLREGQGLKLAVSPGGAAARVEIDRPERASPPAAGAADQARMAVRLSAPGDGVPGVGTSGSRMLQPSHGTHHAAGPVAPASPLGYMDARTGDTAVHKVAGALNPPPIPQPSTGWQKPGPGLAVAAVADFEGSLVGSAKAGELWFRNGESFNLGQQRDLRRLSIGRAFQEAKSLSGDAGSSTAFGLRPGDPLAEMARLLMQLGPAMLRRILNHAPRADATFGTALLFLLLALRRGGLRHWLGEDGVDEIHRLGRQDLLEDLAAGFVPVVRDLGHAGCWRVLVLPFIEDGALRQSLWAVREQAGGAAEREFVLQLSLSRLGRAQVRGLCRAAGLDLTIFIASPVAREVSSAMRQTFSESCRTYRLGGAIRFTADPGEWLGLAVSEPVDHSI